MDVSITQKMVAICGVAVQQVGLQVDEIGKISVEHAGDVKLQNEIDAIQAELGMAYDAIVELRRRLGNSIGWAE